MPLLSTRCPWNFGEGRSGEEWGSHQFERKPVWDTRALQAASASI